MLHEFSLLLAATPLDLSRLIVLRALVISHVLQADMLQSDTHATPCSQRACHCSSETHGIGTVTDIPIRVVRFIYRDKTNSRKLTSPLNIMRHI